MKRLNPLRATVLSAAALLALAATMPSQAESFASSASSAGSASSGSVSDSIKGSSDSSTKEKKVTEGQYKVLDVAEVTGQPALARLKLRATANGPVQEFFLELPRVALAKHPVATGDLVQASQRPYGFEFARFDTREAFFLVLNDDWVRDLDSHVVAL